MEFSVVPPGLGSFPVSPSINVLVYLLNARVAGLSLATGGRRLAKKK
jgi:hypothetical protein